MARRDRVTHRKQLREGSGKRNVNPKLSAFQRDRKRDRLANQPPVNSQNEAPKAARDVFNFIEQQQQARREYREKKYGAKKSSATDDGENTSTTTKDTTSKKEPQTNNKMLNNATSLNKMLGCDLDGARMRLNIWQKKEKLKLKKRLKRRSKRQVVAESQLNSLMALESGASAAEVKAHALEGGRGAMTRKQKNQIRDDEQRKQEREEEKRKRMEEREKALAEEAAAEFYYDKQNNMDGADMDDDGDEEIGEERLGDDDGDGAQASYDEHHHDDDADERQLGHNSAVPKQKKSVQFSKQTAEEREAERRAELRKQRHEQHKATPADFANREYVSFTDRVDAPPVLDVVPSASLSAALERRTKKLINPSSSSATTSATSTTSSAPGGNKKNKSLFRVTDTAGQTSISERAQKIVHGGHQGASDLLTMPILNPNESGSDGGGVGPTGSFLDRPVSGAKLNGKEDFSALRERVLASYAKFHPKTFGKERTYKPL